VLAAAVLAVLTLSCSPKTHEVKEIAALNKEFASVEMDPLTLGPSDELSIRVTYHQDLDRTLVIDPEGNIAFPLAGTLRAEGETPASLTDRLSEKLAAYIVDPRVDVNISKAASRKIVVLGEVNTPGVVPLTGRMTFWELMGRAGGFTDDADPAGIVLVRNHPEGYRVSVFDGRIPTDASDSTALEALRLRNNDILYVNSSRIAGIDSALQRFSSILGPYLRAATAIVLTKAAWKVLTESDSGGDVIIGN
jgi:polysaccharide export outer membrane protein